MRRLLLACVALATALLLGATVGAVGAQAAKCKQRGDTKVCISVKKQTCKAGRPTLCERWRNECRTKGRKGFFSCVYKGKQSRCRGSNGRRCRTTYINCTTNPRKRVCQEFTAAHCSSNRKRQQCQTIRNRCVTGRANYYRCLYERRTKTCPKGKPCFRVTTRCVSMSRTRKARCQKNKYTDSRDVGGGGGGTSDEPAGGGSGTTDEEPPAETTGDEQPADEGSSGGGTITPIRR